MPKLEKDLKALSKGKDLPWDKVGRVLNRCGMQVQNSGSGSHYKVFIIGKAPLTIPVHKGKIKKVYAKKIAEIIGEYISKNG